MLAEVEPRRAALAKLNFPEAAVLVRDVSDYVDEIEGSIRNAMSKRGEQQLFMLSATPPCQGMSKNGIGTLLRSRERGLRPKVDPRNRLYQPVIELVDRMRPEWIFFENVCRMMNTYDLDADGVSRPLCAIIEDRFAGFGYTGYFQQVQLADYGLPQTRLRTIGIFRHVQSASRLDFLPPKTHSESGGLGRTRWTTLRQAIGNLPALDSANHKTAKCTFHPLHRVPLWRPELYEWMKHTPEGRSAFDNTTCPDCGTENDSDDLACQFCDATLPRPQVADGALNGRLIKGFVSAYKRMFWDKPSSTVTTRSAYACSDHKVHPDQNRVLSTFEVALLQGIDPHSYNWSGADSSGRAAIVPDTLARDVIGECIPPAVSEIIGQHLLAISGQVTRPQVREAQIAMF